MLLLLALTLTLSASYLRNQQRARFTAQLLPAKSFLNVLPAMNQVREDKPELPELTPPADITQPVQSDTHDQLSSRVDSNALRSQPASSSNQPVSTSRSAEPPSSIRWLAETVQVLSVAVSAHFARAFGQGFLSGLSESAQTRLMDLGKCFEMVQEQVGEGLSPTHAQLTGLAELPQLTLQELGLSFTLTPESLGELDFYFNSAQESLAGMMSTLGLDGAQLAQLLTRLALAQQQQQQLANRTQIRLLFGLAWLYHRYYLDTPPDVSWYNQEWQFINSSQAYDDPESESQLPVQK